MKKSLKICFGLIQLSLDLPWKAEAKNASTQHQVQTAYYQHAFIATLVIDGLHYLWLALTDVYDL